MNESIFPSSEYEALAILYIQNPDLSDKTPEELLRFYKETEKRIYHYAKENMREDWMQLR